MKPEDVVVFNKKVFEPPYAPYYDSYKGHIFKIVALHEGGHVELTCVDLPTLKIDGFPHDTDVELADMVNPVLRRFSDEFWNKFGIFAIDLFKGEINVYTTTPSENIPKEYEGYPVVLKTTI